MKYFAFYYQDMEMGGIQNIIYDLCSCFLENNISILWIGPKRKKISLSFKDVINENMICFVDEEKIRFDTKINDFLDCEENDQIVLVSFDPLAFNTLRIIKYNSKVYKKIQIFLIIPHFSNNEIYLERHFIYERNKYRIHKIMSNNYLKWFKNHELLFCNKKHYEKLEEVYNISFDSPENYLLKLTAKAPPYNSLSIKNRAKKEIFDIITVSRLEFPHKGYVIGLINIFSRININYPHTRLHIVGDGPGLELVKKTLMSLPQNIVKNIYLKGEMSPNELEVYIQNMDLNIGLAGGVLVGVRNSVISFPVRHYTYECECYGFYHENPNSIINDVPGKPIIKYIDMVINLSLEEYDEICYKDYQAYLNRYEYDPFFLFRLKNNSSIDYNEIIVLNKFKAKIKHICIVKHLGKRMLEKIVSENNLKKMKKRILRNE